MNEQNLEQEGFVLGQLFSAYANAKVDEGTVAVYLRLLSDIPVGDLQTVVDQCIATSKFLPTVAEIRDKWHSLTISLGQPSAAEAWGEVLKEIRRVGWIGAPQFTNQLIAQVVKMMGWRELCASETPGIERAQFMRMYAEVLERGTEIQKLLPQARDMAQERIGTGLKPISAYLPAPKPTEGN